uniref:Uncharacterized protein n=1 Tax=Salix viminalis TaxID=40686 RepID=A0A6N2KWY5_SALVM
MSSSYDSSEDESSDDEEIPAKASAPKNVPSQPVTIKKTEVSEDSKSDSDSDESFSEDEGKTKSATASKVIPKKSEEDDSSESDSDEDETPAPKAASAAETKPKANAQKESSSEEESSSDSSDDEEDSEDEKPVKTPKKIGTDVEMVDADMKSSVKNEELAKQDKQQIMEEREGAKNGDPVTLGEETIKECQKQAKFSPVKRKWLPIIHQQNISQHNTKIVLVERNSCIASSSSNASPVWISAINSCLV